MRPESSLPSLDVVRLGAGVVDLGWVTLGGEEDEKEEGGGMKELSWKMRFVAREGGLKRVGGLRVLLVDALEGDEVETTEEADGKGEQAARIVGEWDVVGELWVGSA